MSSTARQAGKPAVQGFLVGLAAILVTGLVVMGWAAVVDGEVDLFGLFTASAESTTLAFDFRLDVSPWVWAVPALGAAVGAVLGLLATRENALPGGNGVRAD